MLRFLDAGESHGKALVSIIEGLPSNIKIDLDYINSELGRRQKGYGRGARMKIEQDKAQIWSGVRGMVTTGSPITMVIYNKDYDNWKDILESKPEEDKKITVPRPGHGDLVGFLKYKTGDIRDVIERTSARETAIRTAVGALCKSILEELDITIRSKVNSIGTIQDEEADLFDNSNYKIIEESELRCYNKNIEAKMKNQIDICKENGDTIGGSIFISMKGIPAGIGSYSQWDRKLDAVLSFAVMSVQGIKAIEFGNGLSQSLTGSRFNDEIYYENNKIERKTNNCGGIEAGVSNGENIELKAFMKPIPTVRQSIASIDLKTKTNVTNRYERSDVCGVVPASIVLENVCAFEILKEMLNKFPGDNFMEFKRSIEQYRNEIYTY
ncbi:chorismate synthase [Clostridium sp. YIM B02515]|uniref:Chorismate synthase n=1 Tax=Clostridium rhizosphaerae TaxID=2803861 RepID=A0ABS1T658_9CLOT|nr:chorismate synthase [Clostridium rhizosphaerae]MBL4934833.1 chorismate synthase [Clostridium rhizosphaerae]